MANVRDVSIGISFGVKDRQLQQANKKVNGFKRNVNQSSTALGSLGNKARAVGAKIKQAFGKATDVMQKYRYQLLGAATAMAGVMTGITKAGTEFEYQVRRTGLVAEASSEQISQLSEEARRLGIETRYTASEAAEGQEMLARMGFSVKENMEGLPAILDMAAASDLRLSDAARITAKSLNSMNYEIEESTRVADVLLKASTSAGANVAQLGTAFTEVAGEASVVGWEIEELTASLGLLADRGETGTRAGRRLRSVIQDLQSPTAQMQEQMDALNIDLWKNEDQFKSLTGIVSEFENKLEGLSGQKRQRALSNMFTKRGLAVFRKILSAGGDELLAFEDKLQNAGGTAEMMAEEQMDTLKGALLQLKGSINVAAINMSLVFIPVVENIVLAVKNWINVFNEMPDVTQGLVGGLLALSTVTLGVAAAIGMLKGPFLALFGILGKGLGFLGLTATQFGLIAAAVVGTYLVFEDLWLSMEHGYDGVLKPLIDGFLDFMGISYDLIDIWNIHKEIITTFFGGILNLFKSVYNFFKGLSQFIYGVLVFDKDIIKAGLNNIVLAFKQFGIGIKNLLWDLSISVIKLFTGLVVGLGEAIAQMITQSIKAVGLGIANIYKSLDWLFNWMWNKISSWIFDVTGVVLPSLEQMGDNLVQGIKNLSSNIWQALKDMWNKTKSFVSDFGSFVWDFLTFELPSFEDIKNKISNWWNDIKGFIEENITLKKFFDNLFDIDMPNWLTKLTGNKPTEIKTENVGRGSNINNNKGSNNARGRGSNFNNNKSPNSARGRGMLGGEQPINKTSTTNKSETKVNEQKNNIEINIDGAEGNEKEIARQVRDEIDKIFESVSIEETGDLNG